MIPKRFDLILIIINDELIPIFRVLHTSLVSKLNPFCLINMEMRQKSIQMLIVNSLDLWLVVRYCVVVLLNVVELLPTVESVVYGEGLELCSW